MTWPAEARTGDCKKAVILRASSGRHASRSERHTSDATLALDHWLADRPHLYRRAVIPARLEWEIRDKLDQSNITARVPFPRLEGLTAWLERHDSPRGG